MGKKMEKPKKLQLPQQRVKKANCDESFQKASFLLNQTSKFTEHMKFFLLLKSSKGIFLRNISYVETKTYVSLCTKILNGLETNNHENNKVYTFE